MSRTRPITKALKKFERKSDVRDSPVEEATNEDVQPWKNIFRPTCALPPKDNSFTLEDDALSTALEGALSSFTVSDPNEEGNPLCYVSPGFVSMTGYSEEECLGRNCKFLQAGKVEPAAHETLRAGLNGRCFTSVEVTNYRKDGRAFQNLLSLAPMFSADNASVLHYVGVQCDLDERRRRGETVDDAFLAKWEEQLKSCLSAFALVDVSGGSSPGASGSSSAQPQAQAAKAPAAADAAAAGSAGSTSSSQSTAAVCAVSPGFTTLTGYSQSDVVGWNMLCLCGPDTAEKDMRKLITSQWAHTPVAVKMLCYKRDGTPFWALVLSYPLSSSVQAGAAQGAAAGPGAPAPAGRAGTGKPASGRGNNAQGVRAGGLGLGIFGGMAPGGGTVGGLLSALAAGGAHGAAAAATTASGCGLAAPLVVKYCLCCIVDITALRLKKVAGGKYVLGKVIGAGAFGLVRIGKNITTEELVAVKGVDATRFRNITEIDQIQEEMSVLASLKHPNIIRLYDVHFQSNTFFLVMEFAGNGSLVQFMRAHGDPVKHSLDEVTAARVFVQMVSALDYCHRRRVVHRDLKPENILVDEHNNLKIADFGLAAVAAPFSGGLTLQCGTPEFTAPEITVGREYDGASVDIWSMGVILYEVLCGTLPFKGANQAALFKAIQRGTFNPLPSHVSSECKDLVRRMLVVDPQSRITMDEILRHPWVTKAVAKNGADGRTASSAPAGSPSKPGSASAGSLSGGADPPVLLRLQASSSESVLLRMDSSFPGPNGGGAGPGADDYRVGSASRRDNSGAGGAELRVGVGSGFPDGSGPQRGLTSGALASPPRTAGGGPTSPSMGGGGPELPVPGSPVSLSGVPAAADGLHDSVKLVLPSQANRDDPILAALLRHAHVGGDMGPQSASPSRLDEVDEADLHLQRSPQSYSTSMLQATSAGGAAAPRRDGGAAARGAVSRTIGGAPSMSGGSLHGQNQANGKSRGGALLPTLGGAASTGGNAAGGSALERRMQEATRFRSPARTGQAGATGRGTGAIGGRAQPTSSQQPGSPASPIPSPHGGNMHLTGDGGARQLPPIQATRAPGKKSSWLTN